MSTDGFFFGLIALMVGLWALGYFGGNWQANRNMRKYDQVVSGDPHQIVALAAKGLKGRNPMAAVSVRNNTAERTIERNFSAGPFKGTQTRAVARIECTPAGPGQTRVVAENQAEWPTKFGIPASLTPLTASRRGIERAMKLISAEG